MALKLGRIATGIATGGLSEVAGLLSKKGGSNYDPTFANQTIDKASEREQSLLSQLRPENQKLTNTFGQSVDAAQEQANQARRSAASEFLANYDPLTSRIIQERQDQLKRQSFGQIPELVQAAREAGAAGGGLDRGVIQNSLAQIPIEQGRQYMEGVSDLNQQALNLQLGAREKVYNNENQAILQNLGIDTNTAEAILNSNNSALIGELNGLIDEARNTAGLRLGTNQTQQNVALANAQNQQNQRNAILNSLLQVGGTVAGGLFGGPAGAAVGNQIGGALGNVNSNASMFAPTGQSLTREQQLRALLGGR